MALTSMDGLVTALTGGQILPFYKAVTSTKGAGYYNSYWRVAGEPGAGDLPASGNGEAVTKATLGAMAYANAGGTDTLYIGRASFSAATIGSYMLYDRLVQTSGLVGNTTSPQNFASAALTRYTTGEGVRAFIEIYTGTSTGAPTVTVSYTNQAGTAARSGTATFVSSPSVGQIFPITLQAGDTGIRSIEGVTLSVGTSVAGDFGIVLYKPLMDFQMTAANIGVVMDAIACGLPALEDDACLALMMIASTTSAQPISGQLNLVAG